MSTFTAGDKVLFHQGPGYVGTVCAQFGGGWTVTFHPGSSDGWLCLGNLTKLPADTPVYRTGTVVQVRCDAPHNPGCRGEICGAELQGVAFGYWLNLVGGEQAWIPAKALIAVDRGVSR
jgi:hypothetical protein